MIVAANSRPGNLPPIEDHGRHTFVVVHVVVRNETPRGAAQVDGLSWERRLTVEYQPGCALTVQYLQPVVLNAVSLSLVWRAEKYASA